MNNDLISRSALKEDLAKEIKTNDMGLWLKILLVIDNAPTVEAYTEEQVKELIELNKELSEERPQGEWKYRKEWFEDEPEERMAWGCSSCGFSIQNSHDKQNYCPYCGVDMRGNKE